MRRRGPNWLLILAIVLVMWYVLSRLSFHIVIPIGLGSFLLLIAGAIAVVYVLLKALVGSRP
ncbi:MAG TPA: hypothetical protein VGE07_20890 [Herpetosiphonaceae bacterium]